MHRQAVLALTSPIYDPTVAPPFDFVWNEERLWRAGLTVNIGQE